MARSSREKVLIISTLVVGAAAFLFVQVDTEGWLDNLSFSGEEFEALEKRHQEYKQVLLREDEIKRSFFEIEVPYKNVPGVGPDKSFIESINNLSRQAQVQGLQIDPPRTEEIKDVDEYGLLFLPVKFAGDYAQVTGLLKQFDASGYLIDELDISNIQDLPTINVKLRIARPVKLSDMRGRGARGHAPS